MSLLGWGCQPLGAFSEVTAQGFSGEGWAMGQRDLLQTDSSVSLKTEDDSGGPSHCE